MGVKTCLKIQDFSTYKNVRTGIRNTFFFQNIGTQEQE
jgi:hypothetical protein